MTCCKYTAAMLRHSITIERKQSAPDGAGGVVLTWAAVASLKAAITPTSGAERIQSMRIQAETTHKIIIRYFADLRPDDRILFDGRYFNIIMILNLEERNRWQELRVSEGVAQ